MKRRSPVSFSIDLADGRKAKCRRCQKQEYKDAMFSSGYIEGADPDTIYLKLERDGKEEPMILLLRPDELEAIMWVSAGVLWSRAVTDLHNGEKE